MLKQLNTYKKKYQHASNKTEKDKIHKQIAGFTQKFLDAKNLQLSMQLRTTPLSKWEWTDGIPTYMIDIYVI